MSSPRISIVMNCLNGARDLPEVLDSVMHQTFTDWELIFWDDNSTDGSLEIAQSYGDKVRTFRSTEKRPLGISRNLAMAEARGEYIAFLDADDVWLPTKLEKQLALFEAQPNVGLVCTDTIMFMGKRDLNRTFKSCRPTRGKAFKELVRNQWISMSSAMIRRSALDRLDHWFDGAISISSDADLFYRLAWFWELDHVDEPLTRRRIHDNNVTLRRFEQFAIETQRILDKHLAILPDYARNCADIVDLLTRRIAFQRAVSLWRDGKGAEARACLAPYADSAKFRLFRLVSYLPGSLFNLAGHLYFSLPAWLRR